MFQSSLRLFAGQERKSQSSFLALGANFHGDWNIPGEPDCVLCKGEELNSEQVLLQEQLNLGFGLYFMEKLLKSKNKSNTLKQQGNGKLQGTGVSIFWTKPFTDSDFFFFINMLLKQHRICFNECFALALRVCTFTYFIEYSELPSQHLWVSMLPAWVSPTDFLLLLLKMRWFPIAPPASNSLINKNQGDSQAEALQAWWSCQWKAHFITPWLSAMPSWTWLTGLNRNFCPATWITLETEP